ncbi:MAG: AmmeMemoRadiSam system protein B [Candidatus Bathyarchaeota archaeon]|nr:AmmeMemoRadiSam system protein B [Candidatus Bathyarchaeota archaeon]
MRRPYVAGSFYPRDPRRLRQDIEDCFKHALGPGRLPAKGEKTRTITALVCPHAGYMYSGPVAAHSYLALSEEKAPETAVILCPNHTGLGSAVSLMGDGYWETPLGRVKIDPDLSKAIFKASGMIDLDESAHQYEHSIEVQLPFLQYIYGSSVSIVPICMGFQDLETSRNVGEAVAEAARGRNVVIIASTDMTHQEPQQSAARKDRLVLDAIEAMNEEKVQEVVRVNHMTMCGYGPVSAAIVASKRLGADRAEILSYHTSGDITGDRGAVVGYASAKITRTVQ